MSTPPLRLLLDQNFPLAPQGLVFDRLDKTVSLEHFGAVFPQHAKVSTPDWKVYLLARSAQFDAVITSDVSQLSQDTEMVALELTKLGLITWNSGEPDVVVLYGQLLAYMPQIVKQLQVRPTTVIVLSKAYLRPRDHFKRPGDVMRERDQRDGLSWPQRRGEATTLMRRELDGTSDQGLLTQLT